jgi:REP element-mobilizing transposase RayT
MPHSLTDLVVHVIFSTKGRCPLLDDALKPRLFAYVKAIVQAHGGRLHNINGAEDHLHLLLSLPTTMALADLMRLVKGRSSHWIRQEFPERRHFGWQNGYAAFSVSRSRLSRVYEYIARQPDHHKKVTFREEFLAFLRKHEISYDEKFLKI